MKAHWDQIYGSRAPTELSWFQREHAASLALIAEAKARPDAAILDVGGGASTLVDALLARGYRDVTVLDVSPAALDIAGRRLGDDAAQVRWVAHDVLTWRPPRRYALWHDRSVFHFLVSPDQRAAYRAVLHAALEPRGSVIVATFADDGPEMCSGLPTARYAADALATELGLDLELVTSRREEHITPAGAVQPYTWVLLRARA